MLLLSYIIKATVRNNWLQNWNSIDLINLLAFMSWHYNQLIQVGVNFFDFLNTQVG